MNRMFRNSLMATLGLFGSASTASAVTWFADNVNGNDLYDGKAAVWDGSHGPKATIQRAVDLAAAGDTVVVAPGVYGDDQGVVARDSSHAACRVYIERNITLKSSGGRDVTHIVGKFDYEANVTTGIGPNAVGGVVFAKDAAKNATLKGFTIRDCADSKNINNTDVKGSAVFYAANANSAMSDMPWVADCAISNIYSSCAAVAYVNVARTSFMRCKTVALPYIGESCNYAFCIMAHCPQDTNVHAIRGVNADETKANVIVNCTFSDLDRNMTSTSGPRYFYNNITDNTGLYTVMMDGCVVSRSRLGWVGSTLAIDDSSTNATATSAFSSGDRVIANTAANDWRLPGALGTAFEGSKAIGRGFAKHLERLPEEYRSRDFFGNPVEPTIDGRVHAGAVQTVFTPQAAFKVGNDCAKYAYVNGKRTFSLSNYTVFTETWPAAYDIRMMDKDEIKAAGATTPFFAHYVKGGPEQDRWLFTDSAERTIFVPAKGFFDMVVEPRLATKVIYVDASKEVGATNTGTGTAADPYARLKQAHEAGGNNASNYNLVYVAPGTYGAELTTVDSPSPNARFKITKTSGIWRFIATGGAENTIIPGASDPNAPAGCEGCCSTNAVRCLETGAANVSFQGFTLTGGRTACKGEAMSDGRLIGTGNSYGRGGAIWANNCDRPWLVECIVTNNVAYYGGASMANGHAIRCYFADNRSVNKETLIDTQNTGRLILMGCVADEQEGRQSGGSLLGSYANVVAVNCTFVGNKNLTPFPNQGGNYYNCLFSRWKNQTAESGSKRMKGCLFHDFTLTTTQGNNKPNVNFVTGDPLFADAAAGDFRVRSDSPAVGGGSAWGGLDGSWTESVAYSNFYRNLTADYVGDVPHLVGGLPTIGAYQVPSQARIATSVDHAGGATVTASATVDWGTPCVVTAQDGERQVLGLKVNGEFREGVKSVTLVPQVADAIKTYSVEAVLNADWYVDADGGNDGNTGWTALTAMKTLAGVMAKAASGDTVHALPGVYDEGSSIHAKLIYHFTNEQVSAADIRLPSRVVIPDGVRLVSTEGAEKTVIKGEFAPTGDKRGEGAMRAVLLGKGAYLNGFTVTGGSTLTGSTEYQYEIFDNVAGGGILCADLCNGGTARNPGTVRGLVEDCIVSNNCGCGTSAAQYGSYVHCLFTENHGANYVVREPQWIYGCVFQDNYASNVGVYQPYNADFCTFGDVHYAPGGSAKDPLYSYPGSAVWPVRNCLFTADKGSTVKWAFNCIGTHENFLVAKNELNCWEDCEVDAASVVDGDWRPALDSEATDGAVDPMTSTTNVFRYAIDSKLLRDTDFTGGQRVYNGVQDVGAGEADWRGRFGRDIGRRVAVSSASPTVVENGQLVDVTAGELELVWKNPTDNDLTNAEMTFEVRGDGTLTLTIGDTTETYTKANEKVVRPCVLPARSETSVRFSYEAAEGDVTGAVIGPFKAPTGILLLLR